MALTIREALKFGGLFGAVVVAGQTGLDTPIESISVLEVAEGSISRWVLKNLRVGAVLHRDMDQAGRSGDHKDL